MEDGRLRLSLEPIKAQDDVVEPVTAIRMLALQAIRARPRDLDGYAAWLEASARRGSVVVISAAFALEPAAVLRQQDRAA